MPRKKQAESAKSRRQKLLDYFHSNARQPRFITDIKTDLNIKNEQNLRRDLEMLADEGSLEKSKDTTKLPARAVFILKQGAAKAVKGAAKEDNPAPATETPKAKAAKAPKAPKAAKEPQAAAPAKVEIPPVSSNGQGEELKGRRSARELEQQILTLLDQQPTTVKDLAEHLKRQQPTVTKALERMQERRLVDRKRQGRSFVYSRQSKAGAPAPAEAIAATPVAEPTSRQAAAVASSDTAVSLTGTTLQSIIDAAVRAGVSVALEHILAGKA